MAILLITVAAGVWLARTAIAGALIGAWLAGRGIDSDVRVEALSLGGLKARVRLGPPAHPDVTVDEVSLRYDLTPPWSPAGLGVTPRAVLLVHPTVALRWDGKTLSYGTITPLVSETLRKPPNPRQPGPPITITGGLARLATPYGAVTVSGDGALDRGTLVRFAGTLAPLHLRGSGFDLISAGGPVRVDRQGPAVRLAATAPIDALSLAGGSLGAGRIDLAATAPWPLNTAIGGPMSLRLDARAGRFGGGAGRGSGAHLTLAFDGGTGGGSGSVGVLATGGGEARFEAAEITTPVAKCRNTVAKLSFSRATIASGDLKWSADMTGQAAVEGVSTPAVTLSKLKAAWTGSAASAGATLKLSLSGAGAADPATARRLTAGLGATPAYGQAARRALGRFAFDAPDVRVSAGGTATRVDLGAAARLTAGSGAVLVVAGGRGPVFKQDSAGQNGAVDLALGGGGLPVVRARIADWSHAGAVTAARFTLHAEANAAGATGLKLNADGLARADGSSASLVLANCASLSASHYGLGALALSGAAMRLCPSGGPLIAAGPAGWTLRAVFDSAGGEADGVRLAAAAGEVTMSGDPKGAVVGRASLVGLRIADAAAPPRFEPLTAAGRLDLVGSKWSGHLDLASPSGQPLADAVLEGDIAAGAGHGVVETPRLVFAKGGLQPAGITILAKAARDVEGPLSVTGRFDWTAKGLNSQGEVSTPGLSFKSPVGEVHTLVGDVRFDSLLPASTPPDQRLTVAGVDAFTPVSDVSSIFSLTPKALRIDGAEATIAHGRVSLEGMDVPFSPGATLHGAVVLDHVNLGEIVAASSMAKSVKLEAVIDGRLPFTVGPEGLRFTAGRLVAVQPGRIEIARAALTGIQTSGADTPVDAKAPGEVNAVQDFAYQAMENLQFDALDATIQSLPHGRLGVLFHIRGRHDPPKRQELYLGVVELLRGTAFNRRLPLPSGVPIDLTLDTSLNFDELLKGYRDIWKAQAKPTAGSPPVQP